TQRAQQLAAAALRVEPLLQSVSQARPRLAQIGVDLEQLLVQLDREVVVAPAHGLVGLLELLAEIHSTSVRARPRRFGAKILVEWERAVNASYLADRCPTGCT